MNYNEAANKSKCIMENWILDTIASFTAVQDLFVNAPGRETKCPGQKLPLVWDHTRATTTIETTTSKSAIFLSSTTSCTNTTFLELDQRSFVSRFNSDLFLFLVYSSNSSSASCTCTATASFLTGCFDQYSKVSSTYSFREILCFFSALKKSTNISLFADD